MYSNLDENFGDYHSWEQILPDLTALESKRLPRIHNSSNIVDQTINCDIFLNAKNLTIWSTILQCSMQSYDKVDPIRSSPSPYASLHKVYPRSEMHWVFIVLAVLLIISVLLGIAMYCTMLFLARQHRRNLASETRQTMSVLEDDSSILEDDNSVVKIHSPEHNASEIEHPPQRHWVSYDAN